MCKNPLFTELFSRRRQRNPKKWMELFTVISVLNWKLWKVKLFWLGGKISLQCGYYGSAVQGRWYFLLWDIWNWIGEKSRVVGSWTCVSTAAVQDQCHVQLNQPCSVTCSRSVSLIRLTDKQCCVNLHPRLQFEVQTGTGSCSWNIWIQGYIQDFLSALSMGINILMHQD